MAHDLADVGIPHADGKVQSQELLRPIDVARQCARRQSGGVGGEHGARRGVPGRLAPERFLDGDGFWHGLADEVGVAHRRRQIGRVRETTEGVVDLRPGGAAFGDEVLRVVPVKRLALLQARGDGVVDRHVLAVKGHLPGDLRAHGAGTGGGDLGESHPRSPGEARPCRSMDLAPRAFKRDASLTFARAMSLRCGASPEPSRPGVRLAPDRRTSPGWPRAAAAPGPAGPVAQTARPEFHG